MSGGRFCFQVLNVLLAVAVAINPLFAQSKKTGEASLRVMVVDPNGEAIPNARVVIAKRSQEAKTAARGEATFAQLTTGKVQIEVSADGFAPQTLKDVTLRAGANQVEVKLQVAAVEEAITVAQDKQEAPRGQAGLPEWVGA